MAANVIDLALSDDENEQPQAPVVAPQRSTANILQLALARAGGAQFRQPQQARQQVLQQARQALYGAPGFGSMQSSYQFENVVLAVADASHFRITSDSRMPSSVNQVANATPEATWEDDCWKVPLDKYQTTVYALTQAGVRFEPIPTQVLSALSAADDSKNDWQAGNSRMDEEGYAKGDQDDADAVSDVPRSVWRALAPFQRYGVSWIVKNNGRALLADEPGLGKTIQAIGAATAYYHEWPLLVVCPSSARFHWEHEFRTWLPDEDYIPAGESGVLVVTSQAMAEFIGEAMIVVVSYDLAHRDTVCDALYKMRPNVVICDESHYLKNGKARRTQKLLPLLTGAKRAILMSGTPALSRPNEIFTQLKAIDQDKWNDPHLFSKRYCQSRRVKEGDTYTHASNIEELHTLLTASIMLRRIKANILKQLPKKKRLTRTVQVEDKTVAAELRADLEEFRERASELAELSADARRLKRKRPRAASFVEEEKSTTNEVIDIEAQQRREMAQQKKALLMSLFRRTGPAKLPAAELRIKELLSDEAGEKILVFGHHRTVLDYLSKGILRTVPHIVINGSTAPRDRQALATKFQTDPRVRVAVLGITAAGVALTLTAASRVIFTELYWTPAALLQAEDRSHRIGQTAEVKVEYLLAPDTVDDLLWPLVHHKMKLLGELFDNDREQGLETAERKKKQEELSEEEDEEHRFSEDEEGDELILDDELEALDREDEDAKDIAKVHDDEDGRVSPPPPPAPVVQRQPSDSQAALFDDDNFVF